MTIKYIEYIVGIIVTGIVALAGRLIFLWIKGTNQKLDTVNSLMTEKDFMDILEKKIEPVQKDLESVNVELKSVRVELKASSAASRSMETRLIASTKTTNDLMLQLIANNTK
jgi:hypothetical protein